MGFLDRVFRSNVDLTKSPLAFQLTDPFALSIFGGDRSESNEIVNTHTALRTSIVYSCVDIIASKMATVPLLVYEVIDGKGMEVAGSHPYYDLLHKQPNPEQDAVNFRYAVMASVLLEGNGYIELERDRAARVVALWHRTSSKTHPIRLASGEYAFQTTDGKDGVARVIRAADMIHIMACTLDGYIGLSPIEMMRRPIGSHIAMDKFGARFFANYAIPPIAITQPGKVAPEDRARMRTDWEQLNSGDNQHRVAILDNGFGIEKLGLSMLDAAFIENNLATKRDIASIYHIPGHMVQDSEKGIKANVEQQAMDFLTTCLSPWLIKWETAINAKLFSTLGRSAGRYVAKFNTRSLIRPDAASQLSLVVSGIQNGVLSINEGREIIEKNPIGSEGDRRFIQLNMQPLDSVDELIDAKTGDKSAKVSPVVDSQAEDENEANSLPLSRLERAYKGVYKRGITRLVSCDQRSADNVYRSIWPVLEVMSISLRQRNSNDIVELKETDEIYKAMVKLCEGVAHRVINWKSEDIDTITAAELRRSLRSLVYAGARDAANTVASKSLEELDDDSDPNDDQSLADKLCQARKQAERVALAKGAAHE